MENKVMTPGRKKMNNDLVLIDDYLRSTSGAHRVLKDVKKRAKIAFQRMVNKSHPE